MPDPFYVVVKLFAMCKSLFLSVAGLLLVSCAAVHADAPAKPSGLALGEATRAWLDSLDAEQRGLAVGLSFDDERRTAWHYWPKPQRKGLQLRDMTRAQRELAMAILKTALSQEGYRKAQFVMDAERIIDKFEDGPNLRDPLRYFFTVFGTPAPTGPWGLSVEGHHLSLNHVVRDGKVAGVTPAFFGANPAVVKVNGQVGPAVGTRSLADEELIAYELLASCTPQQRDKAVVVREITADFAEGHKPQTDDAPPRGLPVSQMNDPQKQTLRRLIAAYVNNMPADVAEPIIKRIESQGFEQTHFAWFGSDQPGENHAYEVRGPQVLILLNNTQPDPSNHPANHIHSVWRTPGHDFGL